MVTTSIHTRSTARKTIWWGVVLLIGGALLIVLVPSALLTVGILSTQTQDLAVAVETVLQVAREVVPPLGAALIGSGLVMDHIDKRRLGQ